MRAVVITHPGGPEVLEIRDLPFPDPGPGQVRIQVRAFGVNRADLLQRRGLYPPPADVPEDIPGLEFAGEVESLGQGVEGLSPGDRVMGIVGGGSYAEALVCHAEHVVRVPGELSWVDAAAIPEVFMTAHDALERLDVHADEWVLVHAVGSGVGTAALQLISSRGARCVGTSRTAAKLERARAMGLAAGIDTAAEELVPAVKKITGGGAHAAVDLVGGKTFSATLKALAPRGRVILVGLTGGLRAEVNLGVILSKRLRIEGTVLRARSVAEKTRLTRSFTESVLPLFAAGLARPVLDRTFPLDKISNAHEYMESNANFGKIVITVS